MFMLLTFVMFVFSVATLSRLIVDDKITTRMRESIIKSYGAHGMLTYFVHCTRCTSIWISFILGMIVYVPWGPLPIWADLLAILATTQMSPMVLSLSERIDDG